MPTQYLLTWIFFQVTCQLRKDSRQSKQSRCQIETQKKAPAKTSSFGSRLHRWVPWKYCDLRCCVCREQIYSATACSNHLRVICVRGTNTLFVSSQRDKDKSNYHRTWLASRNQGNFSIFWRNKTIQNWWNCWIVP